MRSQVLFVEDLPGCLRIDGTAIPGGAPLSLVVRVPESDIVADAVGATVQRWADELHVVDIEPAGAGRVVLTDGRSSVRLDLTS